MKTVYKYEVPSMDCTVRLPKGAKLLTLKLQRGTLNLWALVDPTCAELEDRHILIVGTGWDVEDTMRYITTYFDEYFVWHAFELIKE
jgi:hypothetical protein